MPLVPTLGTFLPPVCEAEDQLPGEGPSGPQGPGEAPGVLGLVESMCIAHCVAGHTHNRAWFPQTLLCQGVRVLSVVAKAAVVLQGKGSHGGSAEPAAAPRHLRPVCPP